jgi:hypothetical protein
MGFIVLSWCCPSPLISLFVPMGFLHVFSHYYYLPETAAAVLAAVLIWPGGVRAAGLESRGDEVPGSGERRRDRTEATAGSRGIEVPPLRARKCRPSEGQGGRVEGRGAPSTERR